MFSSLLGPFGSILGAANTSGGGGGGVANTMSLSLPTGTATNYPYQFGRVFKQGVIANYPQVLIDGVAQTTQADVKNRWPDGSVKFAILSLVVPSLSTSAKTFTFQNQVTVNSTPETKANMLANYDFNCTINATSGGSPITGAPVSARTILNAVSDATLASNTSGDSPNSRYWTQGPICTTVILCDHTSKTYDFGTNASKVLRPIFHVQFWPTLSQYKVRVIVEGSDTTKMADQLYDVSVSTGNASPTTVYTKAAVPHALGTRWTKSFWSGAAPVSLNADHNTAYVASTYTIPNFDPSVELPEAKIAATYATWTSQTRDIYNAGYWTIGMQGPGGRPEISLFPQWNIDFLHSGDYRLQIIAEQNTELAFSWPMAFREGSASKYYDAAATIPCQGFPSTLYSRPSFMASDDNTYITGYLYGSYFTNAADRLTFVPPLNLGDPSPTNNNGWQPYDDHVPQPFFIPYLTTGEYVWLEQMQFWASWSAFDAGVLAGPSIYSRGPTLTNAALPGAIRRKAWILRNRVSAAVFSLDSSKEKTYYNYLINDAIAIQEGILGITGSANQGGTSYLWGENTNRVAYFGSYGVSPLHMWDYGEGWGYGYNPPTTGAIDRTVVGACQAPFQIGYMLIALSFANDNGYAASYLRNWTAYYVTEAAKTNDTAQLLALLPAPSMYGSFDGTTLVRTSWIPTWAAAFATFTSSTYPETTADSTIPSFYGGNSVFAAATATITDVTDGQASYSWMKTNWVDTRPTSSAYVPWVSGWSILPRTGPGLVTAPTISVWRAA
jgi:hypothetical protein